MEFIIGILLIIALFLIELFRQIPVRVEDRSSHGVWTIIAGIIAYTLWKSYADHTIQTHDVVLWATTAFFHVLWGVYLSRKLQETPRRKRIIHSVLALGGLGLFGYGCSAFTSMGLGHALHHKELQHSTLTPHLVSFLFALYTWALASVHIRRWFPRKRLHKKNAGLQVFKSIDFGFFLLLTAALPAALLGYWFDWIQAPPGLESFALITMHSMVIIAISSALFGVHELIGGDTLAPLKKKRSVPLKRLIRPTRLRLDIARRKSLWDFWQQVLPTTGFPLVFTAAILGAYHLQNVHLLYTAGAALLSAFLWTTLRNIKRQAPWGPSTFALNTHAQPTLIKGLEVHKKGIYIDIESFKEMPQTSDQTRSKGADNEDTEDTTSHEINDVDDTLQTPSFDALRELYTAHKKSPRDTLFVPFKDISKIELRPQPPRSKSDENGDDTTEPSWKLGDWDLRITLGEYTIYQTPDLDTFNDGIEPTQRLQAIAETIQLGRACRYATLILPDGTFDPHALSGGISQGMYNDLRAFSATWDPSLLTKKDLGKDNCLHPTFTHKDPNKGWWLFPKEAYIQKGGLLWMALVFAGALLETGHYLVYNMDDFNTFHSATVLLLRAFLIAGMLRRILSTWCIQRNPDVYALRVEDEGLNIQGSLVPWSDIAKINLLPSSEVPLYYISNGVLYGIPANIAPRTRLPIAARIGHILPKSEYIRAQGWR